MANSSLRRRYIGLTIWYMARNHDWEASEMARTLWYGNGLLLSLLCTNRAKEISGEIADKRRLCYQVFVNLSGEDCINPSNQLKDSHGGPVMDRMIYYTIILPFRSWGLCGAWILRVWINVWFQRKFNPIEVVPHVRPSFLRKICTCPFYNLY